MKILAIETSCDDTGIAVLEIKGNKNPSFSVLSNIIASQIEVHKQYGGVYPMMAKKEHQRNLVPILIKSLKQSKLLKNNLSSKLKTANFTEIKKILEREPELEKKLIPFLKKYGKPNIDLISVTSGPGLEPCLWVGVNFAKVLSLVWDIPIVPVNHIESHILVNFLEPPAQAGNQNIKFPAIALVVSGGHTQIILMKKIGKYKILGETRDDAAGECFDKCAKILGLGYPGGPIIATLAEKALQGPTLQQLPRPMIGTKDYDFSFSGLKTAVLYAWQKIQKDKKNKDSGFFATWQKTQHSLKLEFAAEVQQAIIDVLIKKTIKAVKDFNAKSLILGGGVSANQELRKQFKNKLEKPFGAAQGGKSLKTEFFVPKTELSTDNGLMTAITGFYHKNKTVDWKKIQADGNLRIG